MYEKKKKYIIKRLMIILFQFFTKYILTSTFLPLHSAISVNKITFLEKKNFFFSIGAVFLIKSIEEFTDELGRVWLITIRLVDEQHEQELCDLFDYFKTQIGETSSLFDTCCTSLSHGQCGCCRTILQIVI